MNFIVIYYALFFFNAFHHVFLCFSARHPIDFFSISLGSIVSD